MMLLLALVGCARPGSEHDAYVILDARAQAEGFAVRVGEDLVTSPLPIAVSPDEDVAIVGDEETTLNAWTGDVFVVSPHEVRISALGVDATPHALELLGDYDAIAEVLDEASVEAIFGDDGVIAVSEDVFAALSSLAPPDGVAEVKLQAPLGDEGEAVVADAVSAPEGRRDEILAALSLTDAVKRAPVGHPMVGSARDDEPQGAFGDREAVRFVGVYRGQADLVLDASGGFWRESDQVRGTWTLTSAGVVLVAADGERSLLDIFGDHLVDGAAEFAPVGVAAR